MKRICSFSIIHVILLGFLLTLTNSCKTEVDPKLLPVLTTTAVTNTSQNTAASGGNISRDGGSEIIARGVCWSLKPNPTIKDSLTEDGTGIGTFTSSLKNLLVDTNYYVRAFATNKYGTAYGLQETFKTLATALPVLTTVEVTDVTLTTVTIESNISSNGGSTITASGVCWSTTTNPTINDNKTSIDISIGAFTSSL